ncbi:hypothetical protein KBC04_01870 [Candidatus Babeliales bacterium]|nr:hypothetical protein [Candidatus Babeliales bacterium]MBP9843533.1 hypothetical protein [Candidatus Babeliales bacterium]
MKILQFFLILTCITHVQNLQASEKPLRIIRNSDRRRQPLPLDLKLIKFGAKTIDLGMNSMGFNERQWPNVAHLIIGSVETTIGTTAMLTGLGMHYGKRAAETIKNNPQESCCLAIISTTIAAHYYLQNKEKE